MYCSIFLIGIFGNLLVTYVVIEQLGAWRRRRHGDD